MQVRAIWAAAAITTVVAVGSWWVSGRVYHAHGVTLEGPAGSRGWSLMGAGKGGDAKPVQASTPVLRTADEVRQRLYQKGSFQGTEPDGGWVVGADGKLLPDVALRRRFEHYLLGTGEVSKSEMRLLLADDARRDRGDEVARQVVQMWDKYLELRDYDWKHTLVVGDRSTWMPAFDEQRTVRRQILGLDWADAFYREEEDDFLKFVAQQEGRAEVPRDPGEPVPQLAPGKDPASVFEDRRKLYGDAAAQRLAQADAEWADWEARLAAAKRKWADLQADAGSNAQLRKAEMDRYVESSFKGGDRLRVRALLNLP